MTSRLTVVVSQASNRSALSGDQEETLVAELMMTQGLDATMVGPLEYIEVDDTDYLCLSSFNHSFVVVSALATDELRRQWQRLELPGEVVGEDLRDQVAAGVSKRIYHVPLERGGEVASLMKKILQIQQDRSVKTIAIGLGNLPASSPGKNPAQLEGASSAERRQVERQSNVQTSGSKSAGAQSEPAVGNQSTRVQPPSSPASSPKFTPPSEVDPDEGDWGHLDQLVDDLDALDL